ncbi:MAG: cytochrome c biogenesis CcdA family protein [Clostridiales bacterium]|jgi:cytochrome c-type biogenesis protein|nr:cytochrome c biogenesis CcdA family protein [Eubacteriales bacterium]MDH7566530.1 cytochrome c biogenesis CcdA family protein [Clostridiales bacterium]
MTDVSYILSFTEGVLTFISPCILPVLPVYFFYLAGLSYGEKGGGDNPPKITGHRLFINSIAFVLGFTAVFVILGATATSLGFFLKSHLDVFRKVSGVLMVVFGLSFMGIFKLGFLNLGKRIHYEFRELKFFNSIVFGMVFGFAWTPCLTAFLGSVLLMAGSSETVFEGMKLLLVYSAGLGLPFILTSLVFEKIRNTLGQVPKYGRIINMISGIVLILAGILVYTDNLKYLNTLFY